jgi:methylated-DNA-[protein]-cysteine S-methyltransferase
VHSAYAIIPAPWGRIHIAASERGVVGLELFSPTAQFSEAIAARLGDRPLLVDDAPRAVNGIVRGAAARVAAFLGGDRDALTDVPVDLRTRSAWDRRVLDGVRQIPFGAVTSYGRLARLIGSPGAARAVGGAVGRNPIGLIIPCHRVIAGDGSVGGYGGDWWGSREEHLAVKRELLALEGIRLPAHSFVG